MSEKWQIKIFRRFRKIAKSDYKLSHVCLAVRTEQFVCN